MERCQCSSKGVCELSPSVSVRLGFPECGLSVQGSDNTGCGEAKGFCSCNSFSFIKPRKTSESESSRQSNLGKFIKSSSISACTKQSEHKCSCLRKTPIPFLKRYLKSSSIRRFNLLVSFILTRYHIFLLVILLRSVLVEGAPVHKVRHHHFKPDDLPHCSQRFRREILSMSLKESETAGLCPSWACLDIDERRRPVHITRVFCIQSNNSTCSMLGGDFHCTQLHAQVEVWQEDGKPRDGTGLTELWTADNKTRAMVPTKIQVEHGCLCASKKAKPAINPTNVVE